MIYTLTLNPSIDYYMDVNNITLGQLNRSKGERLEYGGKGINVSLMLKALGCESCAIMVIGGFTGKALLDYIHNAGIKCGYAEAEGNTRINVKLTDCTEINGTGVFAGEETLKKLNDILEIVKKDDYVVMSGSICGGLDSNIYSDFVKKFNEKGVYSVVDTSGESLKSVAQSEPWLIKPNIHELGEIFGINIKSHEEIKEYSHKLIASGVKNVFVTMGDEGAFFTDGKKDYFCKTTKTRIVSTVGAGDCTLAGFIYKYIESRNINKSVDFAVKCGSQRVETGSFLAVSDD